jgi:hypothetical protein
MLEGGGSTGSPRAVTYAEDSPPSTLKSVPCGGTEHVVSLHFVIMQDTHRHVAAVVTRDCESLVKSETNVNETYEIKQLSPTRWVPQIYPWEDEQAYDYASRKCRGNPLKELSLALRFWPVWMNDRELTCLKWTTLR